MNEVPIGTWNEKSAAIHKMVKISRQLSIVTLITSKIFLLDAILRIDVLIIKRPDIGISKHNLKIYVFVLLCISSGV